ncbi:MAG: MBOAT family protein [Butyrivibrio sp.]|nr:MBOAT family protein [Butyrivibrio sp.]
MTNFSDLQFIFRFLPIFLIAFYIVPAKYRIWILAAGSLVFYAIADFNFIWLLIAATIFNYVLANSIFERKKEYLIISICFDIMLLLICKIFGQAYIKGFLPIGISFYTFKMISYQIDIYKGIISEKPDFIRTITYFIMFPQITSGPIMRYNVFCENTLLDNNEDKKGWKDNFSYYFDQIEDGLRYFIMGLSMKVLIADHLAMGWKEIGTIGYSSVSTPLSWFGAVIYSLNLYFDFWGYSLMAAGIGVMIGFPFVINFDHPYSSKSVAEFYRRWHITLGSWFKDYVYIPLGGSRQGKGKTIRNLFMVWVITGFWHGVTFNFILWGGILFLLICIEKFILGKLNVAGKIIGRLNVLVLIPITWVIFAISNASDLISYLGRMFPFFGIGESINYLDISKFVGNYGCYVIAGLLLLIPTFYDYINKNRKNTIFSIVFLGLFWICVYSMSNAVGNPFMYLRF